MDPKLGLSTKINKKVPPPMYNLSLCGVPYPITSNELLSTSTSTSSPPPPPIRISGKDGRFGQKQLCPLPPPPPPPPPHQEKKNGSRTPIFLTSAHAPLWKITLQDCSIHPLFQKHFCSSNITSLNSNYTVCTYHFLTLFFYMRITDIIYIGLCSHFALNRFFLLEGLI